MRAIYCDKCTGNIQGEYMVEVKVIKTLRAIQETKEFHFHINCYEQEEVIPDVKS